MFTRDQQLKDHLVVALLYHRTKERGADLNDGADVDLANRHELKQALIDYFSARSLDHHRPSHPNSTFLRDVASLMAKIEQPELIFEQAAKETALDVVGRLLRFEAWSAKNTEDENFSAWQTAVRAIHPRLPQTERAQRYERLLRAIWLYNGHPCDEVFDPEQAWARKLRAKNQRSPH